MNSRKVNRTFLITVIVYILASIAAAYIPAVGIRMLVGQAAILAVPLVVLLFSEKRPALFVGFCKVKISTILMTVLFTFLIMPLIRFVNLLSMLFVENAVTAVSDQIMTMSFPLTLVIIGVAAPFCEELICRGIFYRGYKKSSAGIGAMLLTALIFAVMHMNFNQAAYAFVIGIIMILLVEATGSLWTSIVCHIVFNSWQVCLLYVTRPTASLSAEAFSASDMWQMMPLMTGLLFVMASICTTLAWAVLVWISKNEKREENLRALLTKRKERIGGRLVTFSLLAALTICLFFMITSLKG